MIRIDFVGAHGAGKSTTFNQLLQNRSPSQWLTPMEAKRKLVTDVFIDRGSPKALAKAATCHLPRLGDIFVNAYTMRPAEQAFARSSGPYADYFEYCLRCDLSATTSSADPTAIDATDDESPPPLRHINLSWMLHRLSELCLLAPLDEAVVFDESLSHATTDFLVDNSPDRAVRNHFEMLPVPDAVVHLTAPEYEIFRRLRDREDGQMHHANDDPPPQRRRIRRTLQVAALGVSTLHWRGSDLLRVDTTESLSHNATKIQAFIADLSARHRRPE